MNLKSLSKKDLENLKIKLEAEYQKYLEQNLNLDMSRGKPCKAQLDLSNQLLESINYISQENIDTRNYGVLDGISECKNLFSEILDIPANNIIIGGNSTLNMIYDCITRLFIWGSKGNLPWIKHKNIKILCPCPGYDRHFNILEKFNFEMIPINITENGIDIEKVEKLSKEDESIKGIICVPLYSNPTGVCYSDETVSRLAKMETKASDFKIFWDNAYAIHHIYENKSLLNIFTECLKYKTEDRLLYFFSTSKVTFAGAGISILAGSENTITETKNHLNIQTIGYDKINQLRTVNFLKNKENTLLHMKKHSEILKPKFEIVLNSLFSNFSKTDVIKWSKPLGGYFVSIYTMKNCASKIINLCKNAGLILTKAGSTYPKNQDISDNNIRIAPSYPYEDELEKAMHLFCICVKIVSIEKLLQNLE